MASSGSIKINVELTVPPATRAALIALGWTPPGALPRGAEHRSIIATRNEIKHAGPYSMPSVQRYRAECRTCFWRSEWHLSILLAQGEGFDHEMSPETPLAGIPGEALPASSGPERVTPETTGSG